MRAAAAAARASRPLARNAATTPVSTSPVPAVASAGEPWRRRRSPPPGAPTSVSGALEQHDAAEPLDGALDEPRAGARRPSVDSAPSRRASSPACGVSTVGAARSNGSSPWRRVGVDDGRQVLSSSRCAHERLLPSLRPRPGPERERASRARPPRRPSSSGRFTASSDERLEHRQRLGAARRSRRSRRRHGTPPAPPAPRRRSSRASRRRRAPSRREYLLSSARFRGTSRSISRVHEPRRVSRGASPMSATATSPAWNRPGRDPRPTFSPVHRHRHVGRRRPLRPHRWTRPRPTGCRRPPPARRRR